MNPPSHYGQPRVFSTSSSRRKPKGTKAPSSYRPPPPPKFLQRGTQVASTSMSLKPPEDVTQCEPNAEKKAETIARRRDPLSYRSKTCTFSQEYLFPLTYDPLLDNSSGDQNSPDMSQLSLSDSSEESSSSSEAQKPKKKASNTFKPYVSKGKKESGGFGFWTTGLEDSLLSGSAFSHKTTTRSGLPNQKTNDATKKDVKWNSTLVRS